jgi:alkanesulfonate monooxygenase SsuD/methylene tetrahydromethanopterin reductase-like flavin-dependent oxidoreductase (luciferase family)
MGIGIGLPAAVPGTPATMVGHWAAESETLGFQSLSVLDRLVYDNLDPLTALAAAAARTERVELLTTVLNVGYRGNAIVLAKQLASVDALSGGRLTAGLALGGWPEDYHASGISLAGRGGTYEAMLATMRRVWAGEVEGAAGPMPTRPEGRPGILFGGFAPASYERVAAHGQGWIAPFFGLTTLTNGITAVRDAWRRAGRSGQPRAVTERYFCLGPNADEITDHYLEHYYGAQFFADVRADAITTRAQLAEQLATIAEAGADDVILFPCSGDLAQVHRLAEALADLDIAPTAPQASFAIPA